MDLKWFGDDSQTVPTLIQRSERVLEDYLNLAAQRTKLFLGLAVWVYGPRLPDALTLIAAWGFRFKSDLLTWLKVTRKGEPAFGTGHTTRKNTEQLLYATRGDGLKVVSHSVRQSILAQRVRHSEKPEAAVVALEQPFGPVRRLELFARRHREGWVCWGNQLSAGEVSTAEDVA